MVMQMKFNEKLITLRKEKGLSQEEFGNILDVSRQSVSKWELGQAQPDVDKIKKICEFYNVSFDYLLDDKIDEKNSENNKKENINNDLEKEDEEKSGKDDKDPKENEKDKKMNKLQVGILIVLFVILFAYISNCIFKAIVFSNILSKNDMDNIESYKYNSIIQKEFVFPSMDDKVLSNITVNEYTCYKDDIYFVWDSYEDDEENCIYYEQCWNYYNGRLDKKAYKINTKIKDAIWEQEYYYTDEGNFLSQDSTFKFINNEMKDEFCIANILNPFKFYKITDDVNIVIPADAADPARYLIRVKDQDRLFSSKSLVITQDIRQPPPCRRQILPGKVL